MMNLGEYGVVYIAVWYSCECIYIASHIFTMLIRVCIISQRMVDEVLAHIRES